MPDILIKILMLGLPAAWRAFGRIRARRKKRRDEEAKRKQDAIDAQAAGRPMARSASVSSQKEKENRRKAK